MADVNVVVISGRIANEPWVGSTRGGRDMMRFRLAVNRAVDADFFQIVCFDGLARDLAERLQKTSRIIVEGRVSQRGSDGDEVDIIATGISFISGVLPLD